MSLNPSDEALFDAASPETIRRLLRRRGVFVSEDMPKEELRQMIFVLSYAEWKELKDEQRSSAQSVGDTTSQSQGGAPDEAAPGAGKGAKPVDAQGNHST